MWAKVFLFLRNALLFWRNAFILWRNAFIFGRRRVFPEATISMVSAKGILSPGERIPKIFHRVKEFQDVCRAVAPCKNQAGAPKTRYDAILRGEFGDLSSEGLEARRLR